jgi:hypothetical protein
VDANFVNFRIAFANMRYTKIDNLKQFQYKLGRKYYLKEYQLVEGIACNQDSLHRKALKRAKSLGKLNIKSLAIIRLILIPSDPKVFLSSEQ